MRVLISAALMTPALRHGRDDGRQGALTLAWRTREKEANVCAA